MLNTYRSSTSFVVFLRLVNQNSTGLQQALMSKRALHRLSTSFVVLKTSLPNHYRLSATDKIGLTNPYRASTTFPVVKTGLANMYKPATGFLAGKNVLPSVYSLSSNFAAVKTALLNLGSQEVPGEHLQLVCPTSTGLQQASWQIKISCQTSTLFQQALR